MSDHSTLSAYSGAPIGLALTWGWTFCGFVATWALMIALTYISVRAEKPQWVEVPQGGQIQGGTRFYIVWPAGVAEATKQEIIRMMTEDRGEINVTLPTGSKIFRQLSWPNA